MPVPKVSPDSAVLPDWAALAWVSLALETLVGAAMTSELPPLVVGTFEDELTPLGSTVETDASVSEGGMLPVSGETLVVAADSEEVAISDTTGSLVGLSLVAVSVASELGA